MALTGGHTVGVGDHVGDHNLIDAALAAKADQSAVDTALAAKASVTALTDGLATKAPLSAGLDVNDVGQDGILVVGQSNARGAGTAYDVQNLDAIDPRIRTYAPLGPNALVDVFAVEPVVQADYGIATSPAGVGPGVPFARSWIRRQPVNRVACVLGTAFGGTAFEGVDSKGTTRQWKVGATGNTANLYENAIAHALKFLALSSKNRIVAILWIQGEQDGTNGTSAATYTADLDALIDGLRTRLSIPTVPFIVGQMTPETVASSSAHTAINAVHIDTPRRKTLTGFAYGLGTGNTDPVNGTLHWSAAAQRAFGPAMYAAYQRALTNITGTPPVVPPAAPVITQTAATTATVTWPQSSGRVTGYVVEINTGGGWSTLTRTATNIDVTQPLTGLTAGSTVQIRYSVVNEQGTSAPSPVATLGVGYVPGQVTGLTAGTATGNTQPLTWTAPVIDSTHSAATAYLVEYKLHSAGSWSTWATVNTTATTVAGLTASSSYDYRVTPTNVNGSGTTSSVLTASTSAPTSFVIDSFTGTAGTALDAHTGETGATWTKHPNFSGGQEISNLNRLRANAATGGVYFASGDPASADYTVEADFVFVSLLTGSQQGICGRLTGSASTYYMVRYVVANAQWSIAKVVTGTTTTLTTYTPASAPTAGQVIHATLTMAGSTLTAIITDGLGSGSTTMSTTDATITAAGKAGVSGSVATSNTTGIHLDNFSAT